MKMKVKSLLGLCLMSVAVCITPINDIVHATDTINSSKNAVKEATDSEKKVPINKDVLNENEQASVVTGADGRLYVVASDADKDKLVTPDDGLENNSLLKKAEDNKADPSSGAMDVTVDPKRQEKADTMDTGVKDFDDVDFNNVEDLQSALNDDDFPFLGDDEAKEALAKSESTDESNKVIQQTKPYFAEKILANTRNFNDVPMMAKSMALAVTANTTATVKGERINPPNGYAWVLYFRMKSGYDYAEDYMFYRTINGSPAFCIEPGVYSQLTQYTTSGSAPLTSEQKKNISAIISAYKYDGGWSGGSTNVDNVGRFLAAQILVWQSTSNSPSNIRITPNYAAATNAAKTRITTIANNLMRAPTYDKTSTTVNKGEKATFTVTSNNYRLSIDSASNGGSASISGNTVTVDTSGVTPGDTVTVTVRQGATSSESMGHATSVWTNGVYQKLVTGLYFTNTTLTVKVRNTGTVEVKKVDKDTNAALSGATFRFTYNGTSKDVVTNSNGIANLGVQLNPGTVVKAKEITAPSGYKLDGTEFSMTVSEGQTVSTTRTNVKETGTLKILKTGDLDGKPLSGVTFSIFKSDGATAYNTGLKTDANGTVTVSGVPFGDYYVKETAGVAGYEPDGKSYKVTISAANTDANPATVTISNIYDVSVTKTVSDKTESNKTTNAWSAAADDFLQYDLTASKLEKSGTNNVTSFVLTDNVDMTKVDISKVQVFTGTTDVSSSFDIAKTDAGVVTAKAKAASLTTASFYDKVYVLRTTMALKSSVKNATAANKAAFTITKGGSVSVGSTTTKSANSNNVTTTLGVATLSETHILANTSGSGYTAIDTLKSSTTKYYIGESYSYAKLADGKKTVDGKLYYYQFSTAGGTASYSGAVTGDVTFKFYYVPFTMPAPTKNVYDSGSSTKLTMNTINLGDSFTYQVQHLVSANFKSIKLTEYSISDTIDSRLTIVSKKIKNASGTDVSSQFDDKTSGNSIKYVAKSSSLTAESFYGVQYTLEVQVKVNTTKIPMDATTKATQVITNEATVSYDNTPLSSNKTTTTLPAFTITDSHMLSKTQLANSVITTMKKNSNKYYRGEAYKVSKMADGKFTYNNVVYYYNFVAALGEASYAGTVSKDQAFNFYYSGVTLDNPAKSVTDKDESNVSSNTIDYNETFTYKVTHEIPSELSTSMMSSYVMTDAIDSKLSIVSKRVLDNTGKDVTSSFTDKTSGNNVRYEATAAALKTAAFYGKTYTFELKVKVATSALQTTSATKTQLSFTNKAYVIPDNDSKVTNTVTSVLPVYTITANHTLLKTTTKSDTIGSMKSSTDKYYRGEAYKYDKMGDGQITLSNVLYYYNFITTLGNASYSGNATNNETFNFYYVSILVKDPTKTVTDSDEKNVTNNTILSTETFSYNVKHEVPKQLATANFSSYVMTDTIDSKLTIVSKRVLDSAGNDVTSLFSDKTSGNNVRYEATATALKTASFYGQTYTYEIKVKAATSALVTDKSKRVQLTFTNKATVAPDNVSKTSNTVTSVLPVYTLTTNHSLLKSATKTDLITSMKKTSEKYYRGDSYKFDKLADGKYTYNNVLYYYNFISTLGNASYSGIVTKDDVFDFYYGSIVVKDPTKTVSDSDQTDVTSNTILSTETFTYKVKHAVPKELATANFDTYVMTDTIDSKLTIVSKRVLDSAGKDVTSLFSDKTSGNNVRYDATATALKTASFYGQTYTYEIKVKAATSALVTDKSKRVQLTFTNEATVTPDNVSKVTNTVTSVLPVYTLTTKHSLLKSTTKTDLITSMKETSEKYYRGDSYKFDKLADGKYTYNNVLYYYNFISTLGNASYSGTVTKDAAFDFYYVSIVVNDPTKTVSDKDQTDVNNNTILFDETFTYNVKHDVPKQLATANFDTYVMADTVDSNLAIVSKRVLDSNGKDVTSLFLDKTSGNNVRYEATAAALKSASFYGQTYTYEIKVKAATSALVTDKSKKTQLTFTNKATVTPDNVSKVTNTVTSILPVYTINVNHTLLKTATTTNMIGSMKTVSEKYYRGEAYKYDKMADGRIILSNVLYYYNFIPSLGAASYSGTVLKNDTFNFYYLSIVVNTPDKKVTDSNQTNVTSNTITAYETYTYNVRHVVQSELATAQFGTYYMSDEIDSKLTIVSSRVLDGSGKDVTALFDKKSSGNTVRYDAKAASLKAASFYGTTYNLEIKVKVSDATLNANGATKRTITINNVANVTPDGVVKNTPKVETTLPAYKVTINHIDVKTKAQLAQDIDYKYDGEKYTYNPRTNLYDDEHNNYKSFVVHTGTINGKDIVLETPYHIPVFTVNIDKIQIDTAKASASTPLPVILTMSDYREYEDELGKIVYRVKAVDIDNKNKVVYTKDFKVADYTDTLKLTLPTDYLTKDKKVNYTFTVELVTNPEENDFNTESGVVKTYGFTASEKVLTNSDLKNGKIDYSAVLRTVKERKVTAVKEYKERVHYDFVTEEKSKTGYGFDLAIEPAYENELNNSATIKMTVVSPKALVDNYINAEYIASGSNIVIPMDKADATTKSESGVRKQTYEYEMPHVNVERGTGALFTDKQVSNKYNKIQHALVDGGNKFYLPIWAELGDYDIFMSSDSTFGQNLIKIDMHKDLNIYAYMYGWIGSKTINRDELVVQPVYADKSYDNQLPDDWTEAEKDWVKDN